MVFSIFNKGLPIGCFIFITFINGYSAQRPSGTPCLLLDGSPGICKMTSKCKWLEEELKSNRMAVQDVRNLHCTFEHKQEVSCCKDSMLERISKRECNIYRKLRQPLVPNHIIGGTEARLGEFPHMAALGYLAITNDINLRYEFKCGGSLVSERYILTAAHCHVPNRAVPVIARLGTLNIRNPNDNPGEQGVALDADIETFIKHPNYTSVFNHYDIALIRLVKTVQFTANLHPACLNADLSDTLLQTKLYITGWGTINPETRETSAFLLKSNITAINLAECNRSLSIFIQKRLPNGINSEHLCAHDPNGLTDSCHADSGGPLQILDIERDMPIIIGVTNAGVNCGSSLPSTYSRVAFFLDWIESVVWSNQM